EQVAPQSWQQRARQALHQVLGENRVAHHGDALDQLPRPYPGQLGRFDGAVELGGKRGQPRPLGGDRRGFGRAILGRWWAQLLDLRAHQRQFGPQRLGRLRGVRQDVLDLDAQAAKVLLDVVEMLQRLLGAVERVRQPLQRLGQVLWQHRRLAGRGWRWRLPSIPPPCCRGCPRLLRQGEAAQPPAGRDQQAGKQAPVMEPMTVHGHSLTAWPKLRGLRVKTGGDAVDGVSPITGSDLTTLIPVSITTSTGPPVMIKCSTSSRRTSTSLRRLSSVACSEMARRGSGRGANQVPKLTPRLLSP